MDSMGVIPYEVSEKLFETTKSNSAIGILVMRDRGGSKQT